MNLLECPECNAERGCLRYSYGPEQGEQIWSCHCGCTLFFIQPEGVFCPGCGRRMIFGETPMGS